MWHRIRRTGSHSMMARSRAIAFSFLCGLAGTSMAAKTDEARRPLSDRGLQERLCAHILTDYLDYGPGADVRGCAIRADFEIVKQVHSTTVLHIPTLRDVRVTHDGWTCVVELKANLPRLVIDPAGDVQVQRSGAWNVQGLSCS